MVVQYTKFLKMGLESKWRGDVAALTYIETSTWTRQGERLGCVQGVRGS